MLPQDFSTITSPLHALLCSYPKKQTLDILNCISEVSTLQSAVHTDLPLDRQSNATGSILLCLITFKS